MPHGPDDTNAAGPPRSGAAAPAMVLVAVLSVQVGAAVATSIFDEVGPAGTVLYRLAFAAVVLGLIWRPRPLGAGARGLWLAVLFGSTLAAMNYAFYEAIDRIPLGIAVTLEFVGPLGVALAGSRHRLDLAWVALAAAGIVLLADPSGSGDRLGILLALAAGGFWAAYILLSARMGAAWGGGRGLAVAMPVAAILMVGPGVAAGGGELLDPGIAAVGLAVAMLSSVIPYSLELEALRRMAVGVFGVLMSLEPGAAALVGLIALNQGLTAMEVMGIALVAIASAGALRRHRGEAPAAA